MASGGPGSHVEVTSAVTLTTTSETVIATITNPAAGQNVPANEPYVPAAAPAIISGVCFVTGGTATTVATVRVRQNSLTGSVVGNPSASAVTGATSCAVPFEALDATGAEQYVVTAQLTSATGNGSALASVDCTPQ
jgi:hypothetical protein